MTGRFKPKPPPSTIRIISLVGSKIAVRTTEGHTIRFAVKGMISVQGRVVEVGRLVLQNAQASLFFPTRTASPTNYLPEAISCWTCLVAIRAFTAPRRYVASGHWYNSPGILFQGKGTGQVRPCWNHRSGGGRSPSPVSVLERQLSGHCPLISAPRTPRWRREGGQWSRHGGTGEARPQPLLFSGAFRRKD
jgi:hypothetical protein